MPNPTAEDLEFIGYDGGDTSGLPDPGAPVLSEAEVAAKIDAMEAEEKANSAGAQALKVAQTAAGVVLKIGDLAL